MPSRFPLATDTFEHGKNLTGKDALVAFLNELNSDLRAEILALSESEAADTSQSASLGDLASGVSGLQSEIAQASDDANAAIDSAVGVLNARITQDVAAATSEAQALAAALSAATEAEIAQVSDDAAAALDSAVGVLSARITQDVASSISEAQALAASLSAAADAGISQASSDAAAALYSEVGVLNGRITQEVTAAISDAQALAAALSAATDAAIAQALSDAGNALDSEVGTLNDRIGKVSEVDTADATATVLSAVTPSPFNAVKVFKKIVAHRLDRLESAAYTVEALARAVPASDVLTFSTDAPSDGGQFVVGAETYTWRTAITPGTPNEVLIGVGGSAAVRMEVSIDNAVKAINLSGTDDVEYGAGTVRNAAASAAKASITTLEAVARIPGLAGNSIVSTETDANTAWAGAGTFGGGSDMTVSSPVVSVIHADDAAWVVAIAVDIAGTGYEVKVTGVADTDIKWREEDSSLKL